MAAAGAKVIAARSRQETGVAGCWAAGFDRELCCDPVHGPHGLGICWDSLFNYEFCCTLPTGAAAQEAHGDAAAGNAAFEVVPPPDASKEEETAAAMAELAAFSAAATAADVDSEPATDEDRCWGVVEGLNSIFSMEDCCNTQRSPVGNVMCWGAGFTFDLCCGQFSEQRCSLELTAQAAAWSAALGAVWIVAVAWWWMAQADAGMAACANGGDGHERSRLALLDNAKFLLCVYVVGSHLRLLPQAKDMPLGDVFGDFSEFHTRTFCLISGFVTGDGVLGPESMRGLAFHTIAPLLLWCIALEPLLLRMLLGEGATSAAEYGRQLIDNVFHADASKVCWYWFALVCWRIWGSVLAVLRPSARLIVALAFSALGGYAKLGQTWVYFSREGAFKMNMAVACFPIFVVGQLFPLERVLRRLPQTKSTAALGWLLLAVLFCAQESLQGRAFMAEMPSFGWAYLPKQFCGTLEVSLYWVRGLFKNMLELTKGLAFLLLCCPRSKGLISALGRHSIYPYLLHPVALQGWTVVAEAVSPVLPLQCQLLLLPVALTVLLASWPVRLVFRVFLEPSWLERLLADGGGEGIGRLPRAGGDREAEPICRPGKPSGKNKPH